MNSTACIMVLAFASGLYAQDAQPAKPDPLVNPAKNQKGETISLSLSAGELKGPLAPRYSPPGAKTALSRTESKLPGFDHLSGSYKLGPNRAKGSGTPLVLARSEKGKPYDTLFIDADGDGKIDDKPVKVTPKEIRGKLWSTFETILKIDYAEPKTLSSFEAYPVSLWVVVEKADEAPAEIRLTRRGYLSGTAKVGDKKFDIVLSDSNNDAILGRGDWWEIRPAGEPAKNISSRPVGDFHWAAGKAWKLEVTNPNGKQAKLVEFDPGMTQDEDTVVRDRLREDRLAPRALKPVPFRKDVDAALKDVAQKKSPYFLKFETDWCGPCKTMDQLVFTAKDVAAAAEGIISITVDGDERKDLREKHKVAAYPTGILFDAAGQEITRFVGYQSVKQMSAFLKKGK